MKQHLILIFTETEIRDIIRQGVRDGIDLALNNINNRIKRNDDAFLTKKEAARLLNVSVATISNLARDGILTQKKINKLVRFSREEVEKVGITRHK